jgi:flagellar biosynthesis protein FlhB
MIISVPFDAKRAFNLYLNELNNRMNKKVIILLLFLAVAVLASVLIWKWVFRKAETDMASKKADIEIEAAGLARAYEMDETSANARYLGKVIVVTGKVTSLSKNDKSVSVYLKSDENLSGVMCTFALESVNISHVSEGLPVRIKGICDGYLMDVMLNKCSLVE